VLRELDVSRALAVAITAVYVVLPHYATARLWFAAFGYLLSMSAALGAALLLVRGVDGPRSRAWRNRLGAAALVLVAGLGYEVVLPLALLAGPVAWVHARRHVAGGLPALLGAAGARVYAGLDFGLVAAILVYKAASAEAVGLGDDAAFLLVRLGLESLGINFGVLGVGLPEAAWWGLRTTSVLALAGTGVAAGVLGWHLSRSAAAEPATWQAPRRWLGMLGAGVVLFAAGYAVFVGTARVLFAGLGIGNRTATAAALGVAVCGVAVCGLLATRTSPAARTHVFAGLVTALCAAGMLASAGVKAHWTESRELSLAILEQLDRDLPDLQPGSTVVLAGVCPYHGPAIVFDAPWDLAGALQLRRGDPTLSADVATPRLQPTAVGLESTSYGAVMTTYPYGERLLLYDASAGEVHALPDAATAASLLGTPQGCPGAEGIGEVALSMERRYHILVERIYAAGAAFRGGS
jgi:hypothetical protein